MKTNILLIFAILLTLISCEDKECHNSKEAYFDFHESEDSTFLPYTGSDSLWFEISDSVGNIIDTTLFIGKGKRYYDHFIDKKYYSDYCSQRLYGKAIALCYTSFSLPDSLVLQFVPMEYDEFTYIMFMGIRYTVNPRGIKGAYGYKYVAKDIAGKTYFNITLTCNQNHTLASNCENYALLANREFGILQIVTSQNVILTRIHK